MNENYITNYTLSSTGSDYNFTFLFIMTILYIMLCFMSTILNSMLLWVLFQNKSLHNSTNVMIFNQSLINLYYVLFQVPVQVAMFWIGQEIITCSLFSYLSSSFGVLLGYFCAVIAINRCIKVCLPPSNGVKIFTVNKCLCYTLILLIIAFGQNLKKKFFQYSCKF